MTAPGDFSSGDVLTAADMNALPAGKIVDASRTTIYNATAGYVDVLTCPSFTAVSGRLYKATFICYSAGNHTTGSSRGVINLLQNANTIGIGYQASVDWGTVLVVTALFATTGSTVVKAQARYDIGTQYQFYADANSPMRLWVEDIGLT